MKHAVICVMGGGDDVKLNKLFDSPIAALAWARTAAQDIVDDLTGDIGNEPEPHVVFTIDENFWVSETNPDDYEMYVSINEDFVTYVIHPFDD